MREPDASIRLDKWLWQARFFKTRSKATAAISDGGVRVNSVRVSKPSTSVRPGDVLTFPLGKRVRVIQIDALGARRGPAVEAATLYTDLDPPQIAAPDEALSPSHKPAERAPGAGRPTKRERREIDALRRSRT
ncbi:MAG: RNA-binding S4 domain-containing protein [Pseudomonadota bacterium]